MGYSLPGDPRPPGDGRSPYAAATSRGSTRSPSAAGEHDAGRSVAVVVDTREQAAALNAAIRDRPVAAGVVDDEHATSTGTGKRVGVGDLIATRRNDHQLDVANRDTWTVTHVYRDGALTVTSSTAGQRELAEYVREHVELAYASTAHSAQGCDGYPTLRGCR